MNGERILGLLGLALRGGRLVVGEEPSDAASRAKDARLLLLASDAADNTRRRCEHFADAGNCLWLRLPATKAELGHALGRSAVAMVAVTDIGLADAVGQRLAELDPAQYAAAAEKLNVKSQRAARRRSEQDAHEKNLRAGKRRPPKAAAQAPAAAPAEGPARSAAPSRSSDPRRRPGGPDRKPWTGGPSDRGPRKPGDGDRKPWSGGAPSRGPRKPGDGDRKPWSGGAPSRGPRKPGDGDRKPWSGGPPSRGPRKPGDGDRKPWSGGAPDRGPRKPGDGDRKPWSGGAPSRGPRKPGDGDRKPWSGGPRRPGGDAHRSSQGGYSKPRAAASPYAHSHPVKKGKGSFRPKES